MKMLNLLKCVFKVSELVPDRDLGFIFLKLVEEMSEAEDARTGLVMCQDVLVPMSEDDEPYYSELCDVINTLGDLLWFITKRRLSENCLDINHEAVSITAYKTLKENACGLSRPFGWVDAGCGKTHKELTLEMLRSDFGWLAKSINQPARTKSEPEFYLSRMIVNTLFLIQDEFTKQHPFAQAGVYPHQFVEDALRVKLDKWQSKALGVQND